MSIQRYEYLGMQSGDMRINGLFHRKNSGASSAVDNMFFASFMKNVLDCLSICFGISEGVFDETGESRRNQRKIRLFLVNLMKSYKSRYIYFDLLSHFHEIIFADDMSHDSRNNYNLEESKRESS